MPGPPAAVLSASFFPHPHTAMAATMVATTMQIRSSLEGLKVNSPSVTRSERYAYRLPASRWCYS